MSPELRAKLEASVARAFPIRALGIAQFSCLTGCDGAECQARKMRRAAIYGIVYDRLPPLKVSAN